MVSGRLISSLFLSRSFFFLHRPDRHNLLINFSFFFNILFKMTWWFINKKQFNHPNIVMGCCVTKKDLPALSTDPKDIHLTIITPKPVGVNFKESQKNNRRFERWIFVDFFFKDVGIGKNTSLNGNDKIFVAIYDYDARTDEDLTFRVGDLLYIIDDRFVYFSCWISFEFVLF